MRFYSKDKGGQPLGAKPGRKMIVLGNHPVDGHSMQRYTKLVEAAYRQLGADVQVVRPSKILSGHLKPGIRRKFAMYAESFLLFPLSLIRYWRTNTSFHISDHSNSIWTLLPWLKNIRITCHDLFAVRAALGEIPEHRPKLLGRIYQFLVLRGMSRADLVVCVSEYTESDVRRLVKSVDTKVIYNPLDKNVLKNNGTPAKPDVMGQYLLIVGGTGWRKNRTKALTVWLNFRRELAQDIHLVVVGPNLSEQEASLVPTNIRPWLHIKQNIKDHELSALYGQSLGLIQASNYEGFGWPVAECNAHSRLAICSDISVLREIGPHNIFMSSDEPNDWAKAYEQLKSESRRRAAKEFASKFNWENFVERLGKTL
jgi:glycosyltransferase involved in cell wall biosynthesis